MTQKSQSSSIRHSSSGGTDSEVGFVTEPDSDAVDAEAESSTPADSALLSGQKVERVLLIGVDNSGGEIGRTDGMVVAVFDYTQKQIGLISVPRDLWVEIPTLGNGRINTVYRIGARALGRTQGLQLLKSVIQNTLGLPIDYTAAVNFSGFAAAVDELGGITVEVQCPIEDCFWINGENSPCVPLSLTAGKHHLDGATALLFARSRHGRTDIDRGRRQQAVLMGLKNRLIRPTSIMALPHFVSKLEHYVETDMPLDAALRMGALAYEVGKKGIHGLVMNPPVVESAVSEDGKSVLVLNAPQWEAALAELFTEGPPGLREKGTCPASDVGLNWRERKSHSNPKDSDTTPSTPTDN